MTLQVKFTNNSLPGAPALTGQVGSLINVLDAVLVNGFNSKTITSITSSAGVATVTTSTAHGYTVGSTTPIVLDIAGADQSAYNVTTPVTITSTTQFTYPVSGSPASPATTSSSMTCKVSPLGWTKPFSGTNTASYLMPAGSSGLSYGVDDNQSAGSQYFARIRGFETMTAAGVASGSGAGLFPTDAQLSGGNYLYKSISQDSTARNWRIVGDAYGFWLHVQVNNLVTNSGLCYFGDYLSNKSGDIYQAVSIAANTAGNTNLNQASWNFANFNTGYGARSYTQLGSAIAMTYGTEGAFGSSGFTYPNPADNGLYLSKVRLLESSNPRGLLPGLFSPIHVKPLLDGDVLNTVATLPGRSFLMLAGVTISQVETYRYAIDMTGPWR